MITWLVFTEVSAIGRTRDQIKPLRVAGEIQWGLLLKREGVKTDDSWSFAEENSWFNLFSNLNERQFLIKYKHFIVTSSSLKLGASRDNNFIIQE